MLTPAAQVHYGQAEEVLRSGNPSSMRRTLRIPSDS